MRRGTRTARPLEKHVQQHGVTLLRNLGARVYVLGHARPRGDRPSTMQTPGIPDVYVSSLPKPAIDVKRPREVCASAHVLDFVWPFPESPGSAWWEVKRTGETRRPDQVRFGEECQRTGTPYVWGDLDALVAWLIAGGWISAGRVAHYRQPAVPATFTGVRA